MYRQNQKVVDKYNRLTNELLLEYTIHKNNFTFMEQIVFNEKIKKPLTNLNNFLTENNIRILKTQQILMGDLYHVYRIIKNDVSNENHDTIREIHLKLFLIQQEQKNNNFVQQWINNVKQYLYIV